MYPRARPNEREYRGDNKDGAVVSSIRQGDQNMRSRRGMTLQSGEAKTAGRTAIRQRGGEGGRMPRANGEGGGKWSKEERKAHHTPLLLIPDLVLRAE
jgi:hypothetical protein